MHIKSKYTLSLVLLAFLLLACTNKGNKASDSDNNTQLNIGVMSSMDYFPIAVAKVNGFFEDEGLKVAIDKLYSGNEDFKITIHTFYSANERDAAFQSRNLDGTILDYTGAAIQRAGGVKLKLTSQCDGSFVMVSGKDSGVTNIQDLRGKKIAVSRNTIIDFCTDMVLQKANILPDGVEKVEINKIPLRFEMLRNGKIDATMLPDPFATIALQEGNRNVQDIAEMDVHVTGIAFHESAIEQKKEAIQRFYRAYNRAVEYINSHSVEDFYEILIVELGVPLDLVSKIEIPNYTKAQLPQEKDLEMVEQWLKAKDLVPSDFDINTLIATDFIP